MHRFAVEQFDMPVRLVLRPGEPVTEVYTPTEAMAALFASPVQEGPIYESALEACFAATMDPALRGSAQGSRRLCQIARAPVGR
jgi:Protein of unknown function (DUF982).